MYRESSIQWWSVIIAVRKALCLCQSCYRNSQFSIIVGGQWVPRIICGLQHYHGLLQPFFGRSLTQTRTLRFIGVFKSILMSMFTSTVFFSVNYPDNNICHRHISQYTCLNEPSMLTSHDSACEWITGQGCNIRPPPTSASFIISVTILTMLIVMPFDIIFYFLLNFICCHRPVLEDIGLSSFDYLGSGLEDDDNNTMKLVEQENAINAVLGMLHGFELRLAKNIKVVSAKEMNIMSSILASYGLHLVQGKILMTMWSSCRYRNIRECVGSKIRKSLEDSRHIVANMLRYKEVSMKETYLVQRFVLEQADFIPHIVLRRYFGHSSHELPLPIHPVPWLLGWFILIASDLFLIYWILAWGLSAASRTVMSWGLNIALTLVQDYAIISFVRIFFLNIWTLGCIRPKLLKIKTQLDRLATQHCSGNIVLQDHTLTLKSYISATCLAAKHPDVQDIPMCKLFIEIEDDNWADNMSDISDSDDGEEDVDLLDLEGRDEGKQ
jgi:hypothetical protein